MDADKVESLIQQLAEMMHSLDKDIAELKVSIAALTAVVATLINPDDPEAGAAHIHKLEELARQHDPSAEQRQRIGDVIEAVKLIRKHGSHET